MIYFVWAIVGVIMLTIIVSLAWRYASRSRSLPCPSLLAWMLDGKFLQRINGTQTVLDRLQLRPGEMILEMGPGPGRLLVPAAKRISPEGTATGIEIQQGMIARLRRRIEREHVTNISVVQGDAAAEHVAPATFDLVFLCTVLGEIPDRPAALAQCFRALKRGGRLSITELAGDPHYQRRRTVEQFATSAGFRLQKVEGHWWFFTATFVKP